MEGRAPARRVREAVREGGAGAGRALGEAAVGADAPRAAEAAGGRGARSPALSLAAKRALDVAVALVQLALTAPVWILVPLAVRLEDGGPVFYGQERVGKGGRRFTSWKFRSMTPLDGDRDGPPKQAELEEHRVTRVGRLLRATALDELPQLWNILVGDMSYVGPRALLPEEEEREGDGEPVKLRDLPGYRERHSVRPGLTGLAQVRLRRHVPHRVKFRHDLLYVRNRSLWLDLKLIVQSVWISVRGKWPEVGREA